MNEFNLQEEMKYLLNSHHELIKVMKRNNDGLQEMNILLRGLISYLKEIVEKNENE